MLKIRELLWTLNNRELHMLEKLLCSSEEPATTITTQQTTANNNNRQQQQETMPDLEDFVDNFYTDYPNCKDFIVDFYRITRNTGNNMDEVANDAVECLNEASSDNKTQK